MHCLSELQSFVLTAESPPPPPIITLIALPEPTGTGIVKVSAWLTE